MSPELHQKLEQMITDFTEAAKEDVRIRWNTLKIDLTIKEVYEVLSGQLARQTTLAIQFASNSNCWSMDLAPVILRCMADNYINFNWISQSPVERARQF